ncbi:MAG: hypothetical protein RLY70_3067, partial [Planctomycetota bacterium]
MISVAERASIVANLHFVRRTSCPSPLEAEFDTASRLRFGGTISD